MKVGMIFECVLRGPDMQVCEYLVTEYLVKQYGLEIDLEKSVTLSNKRNLIDGCGSSAAALMKKGCERVVIVWDLHPAWKEDGEHPCRREDREGVLHSLAQAEVPRERVHLVCIDAMLETWLIADGGAIATAIEQLTGRTCRIPDTKNPERHSDPKTRLTDLFYEHSRRPYQDHIHALKIVKALPNLNKVRRISTFARFMEKVCGQPLDMVCSPASIASRRSTR